MAVGIGPRVPVGEFSDKGKLGVGFDVIFSYTDNKFLPVFFYTKIGYQHHPGKQALYKTTSYASFSSNMITINPGVRYFFPPVVDEEFLLMPLLEGGISWTLTEDYHQFKIGSGIKNYSTELTKFGFHMGAGFSMFLMDVVGTYNYFRAHQYLSFDLRVRIPIFVKI